MKLKLTLTVQTLTLQKKFQQIERHAARAATRTPERSVLLRLRRAGGA